MKYLQNSPIEQILFHNMNFYIKRDDLLDCDFSGNKARKFYYFFINDFPNITKIISHGSSQSNAMYSLSVLAKIKGWEFDYYVKHISNYLKINPHGNYKEALKNGMNIIVGDIPKPNKQTLFIPEGGHFKEAELGISMLAKEIERENIKDLKIFLPSGTGTTALYLQKNCKYRVYTCACVGDENYLKKQFFELEKDESHHPIILSLDKKYHFGKLYEEFFQIWLQLQKDTKIEFDLLYDPKGWLTILKYRELFSKNCLYIHQGGTKGNESMIKRYERKYSENFKNR